MEAVRPDGFHLRKHCFHEKKSSITEQYMGKTLLGGLEEKEKKKTVLEIVRLGKRSV